MRLVGARHILTDPTLVEGRLVEPRGLYRGKALALVRPGSTEEVAKVLAFCNDAGVGVVPQGGNTGLVGGQTPDDTGDQIILSTERLKAIRDIDAHAEVMVCEAGVTLAEAQAAALENDRLFPLSLAAEGTCTIGGNAATNAGGVTVIAYGNTRELVTGVEAVLADGRIVNALTKLRKDNTGYDVKSLFVGSEGTLGVITAVSLRLFPNPRARATAFVGLASPEKALDLLRIAREHLGGGVTSFELIARFAYDITVRQGLARAPLQGDHPWYVLIEASSQIAAGFDEAFAGALEAAFEAGVIDDAVLAASLDQRHEFWKLRESIPEAQIREGGSIKHDVSVAVGDVPAFIARSDQGGRGVRARRAGLPVRPSWRRQHPFQRIAAAWRRQSRLSRPLGCDERRGARDRRAHGRIVLGRARRGTAEARPAGAEQGPGNAVGHAPMKAALDPNGIMNPGKVL